MRIISGLSEGQVLQRRGAAGARLVLGIAEAKGTPLTATIFHRDRALKGWKRRRLTHVRNEAGLFKLTNIPAGGPYRLRVESGSRDVCEIKVFYVGDVWILGGQSNMEGSGRLPGVVRPHPLVRSFSLRREWRQASDPLHVQVESPDVCHNDGYQIPRDLGELLRPRASSGAGPGISFGCEMLEQSGVPQGLICVSRGGSSLAQWSPQEPAQLYASMMESVRTTGQPVAGVLWYQGESDTSAESAAAYTENMKTLVSTVRRDLGQSQLPWVMVQLARVFRIGTGEPWNRVQEQQRLLPELIPNLETVAAIDLSLDDEIHIGAVEMPRLGARLARAAQSLLEKKKPVHVPRLRAVTWERSLEKKPDEKCLVEVSFDSVVGGLRADGEPSGFSLIDPSGVELPWIFKITLRENTARLHLMRLPPPGSMIAYGRGYGPRCNLTDGRDLAMPVFASQPIGGNERLRPFVTTWRVYPPVQTSAFIDEVKKPDLEPGDAQTKTYPDGFINEHKSWQGKSGHAFFETTVELDQARTVELLMGYDGPFRLWINGRAFFCNAAGANPCLPDESGKRITLPAGRHEFLAGMDIAHGRTWGFFLRWRDVKAAS